MEEHALWRRFFESGKIDDYIQYSEGKNQKTVNSLEGQYAAENPGADYQGTDNRRERSPGNSFNAR